MSKTKTPRNIPIDLIDDRMLSVHQIAALDGTSVDTVRREIKRGALTRLSPRAIGWRDRLSRFDRP
jgi:IS30 family transposase